MKVVINKCYGGFGLSLKAKREYLKLEGKESFFYSIEYSGSNKKYNKIEIEEYKGIFVQTLTKDFGESFQDLSNEDYELYAFYDGDLERTDPNLISVVESLGSESNSWASDLKVIDVPDEANWTIEEYDGTEWIAEVHQTWG